MKSECRPTIPRIIWHKRPVSFAIISLIRLYQASLSGLIGKQCKFVPSCSEYFIQAVAKRGPIVGSAKGIWRICRCNPFSSGGWDPIE